MFSNECSKGYAPALQLLKLCGAQQKSLFPEDKKVGAYFEHDTGDGKNQIFKKSL